MDYQIEKESETGAAATEDQLNESSVPDNNLTTEVVVIKGTKFTEFMNMS